MLAMTVFVQTMQLTATTIIPVLLIYAMALRLLPVAFAGIAGLLVALSPHLIASTGYFLTETLFTFYLVLATWLSVQALQHKQLRWFVLVGVVAAFGALTRPVLALYPLVVILLLWRFAARAEWLKLSAAVVVGFALLWSPWQLWKSQHFNTEEAALGPASFALGIYPSLIYKDPAMRGRPYADDPTYTSEHTDTVVYSPEGALNYRLIAEHVEFKPQKKGRVLFGLIKTLWAMPWRKNAWCKYWIIIPWVLDTPFMRSILRDDTSRLKRVFL